MSDTPRTDEAADYEVEPGLVSAELARELERALDEALELLTVCREDCDLIYGQGEGARVNGYESVADRVDAFLAKHKRR